MWGKFISGFFLVILILELSSCAHTKGSKLYPEADYPLTRDSAFSASSPLALRIPQGWTASEDNNCNCTDLWLIRKDFSAMINLFTLQPGTILQQHPGEDTLNVILTFSKDLKKTRLGSKFNQVQEDEFFTLEGRQYGAYEYLGDEGLPIRIVIFRYLSSFFELAAIPTSDVGKRQVDTKILFKVQQSILTSIR